MSNYKLFAGLTKNDQDAIVKIIQSGGTKSYAADSYGVSPRTIGRIVAQGCFKESVEDSKDIKVGDIVTCNRHNRYTYTDVGVPCEVIRVYDSYNLGVRLVDTKESDSVFAVNREYFEKVAKVSKKDIQAYPVQDKKVNLKIIDTNLLPLITKVYPVNDFSQGYKDVALSGVKVYFEGEWWVDLLGTEQEATSWYIERFYIFQSELDKLAEKFANKSTKEAEVVLEDIKPTPTHTEGTFIKVGNSLMVTFEGVQRTISKDHKNFNEVVEKVLEKDFKSALDLMDVSISINKWSKGKITIENGCISYNGTAIHGTLVTRILSMMKEGDEGFERFAKFLVKLMKNPSSTSIKQSYDFIKHNDIEINEKGNLVAFKVVRANYLDKHSGTIDNSVGNFVSMDRGEVDDNRDSLCSHGLHVCAKSYLKSFYSNGDRIVKVELSPKAIVSCPSDYNGAKLRCDRYTVIEDVTEQLTKDGYLVV